MLKKLLRLFNYDIVCVRFKVINILNVLLVLVMYLKIFKIIKNFVL